MTMLSWRRLRALCIKETYQILRDPSSGIMAFILPMLLLVIFGYGINLDATSMRLGLCNESTGQPAAAFAAHLTGTPYFEIQAGTRPQLDALLADGTIRGYVLLASDFSRLVQNGPDPAPIQIVTDGTEPNIATFLAAFIHNTWAIWNESQARAQGLALAPGTDIQARYWYNPAAISRHYLIPGSITIIMTVIGAMLTSLVVAREWERGTMEALLSSPVTRAELLLSKLLPYFVLGMISMGIVAASAVFFMNVPFHGSIPALLLVTSLFLLSMLGLGLLISSAMRNQFDSAQTTLNIAFLPAVMLSGAFFVIDSMPAPIRAITYLLPPRYLVSSLQTIFLAGDIWTILLPNTLFLAGTSILFLLLTVRATRRRLDG
ncbi:MAG: ABC transporter permease [Desulfovibrionales bacterium]|nr:ABC transporter permease [Desulfovibrionales bacterium]